MEKSLGVIYLASRASRSLIGASTELVLLLNFVVRWETSRRK